MIVKRNGGKLGGSDFDRDGGIIIVIIQIN